MSLKNSIRDLVVLHIAKIEIGDILNPQKKFPVSKNDDLEHFVCDCC